MEKKLQWISKWWKRYEWKRSHDIEWAVSEDELACQGAWECPVLKPSTRSQKGHKEKVQGLLKKDWPSLSNHSILLPIHLQEECVQNTRRMKFALIQKRRGLFWEAVEWIKHHHCGRSWGWRSYLPPVPHLLTKKKPTTGQMLPVFIEIPFSSLTASV